MRDVRVWRGFREDRAIYGLALAWLLASSIAAYCIGRSTDFIGQHFAGFRPAIGCIVPGPRAANWPVDFAFGDSIVAVADRPVADREALLREYAVVPEGTRLRHTVRRNGDTVTVVGVVRRFTGADWLNSGLPLLVFGSAFGVLGLTLLALGSKRPEARVFSLICATFFSAAMSDAACDLYLPALLCFAISAPLAGGLMLSFAFQMGPTRKLAWWPIAVSIGMGLLAYILLPNESAATLSAEVLRRTWGVWWAATTYVPFLGLLGFIVKMGLNLRKLDPNSLQALQGRLIFGGAVASFLPPIVAWILPLFGTSLDPRLAQASLFAFVVFPATVSLAVLRYKLFEIEVIVRRTIAYSVVAGFMAVVYLGGMGTFIRYFGQGRTEEFRLALFALMTLAFNPLQLLVRRRLDRLFDRGRMSLLDVQRKLSLRAAEHRDTAQTLEGITQDLKDALKLTCCGLGLVHEEQIWVVAGEAELLGASVMADAVPDVPDWDRITHPNFKWPVGVAAATKIVVRDRVLAVIFLGPKLSQEPLNSQDFDYLGLILGQIGLLLSYTQVLDRQAAVDREMQTLLRKVSELNDLRSSFGIVAGHELRTPLTVIRGHAEALLSGVFGDLDPEQRESIRSIFRSASVMTLQISSYLDLMALREKRLVLRPAQCDLGTIIFEVLETWADDIETKELSVRVDVGGADKAHADSRRVRQVIDQILSNAVKFTPKGGSIVISAKTDMIHVILQIQDSGPGIPSEALERAFDDFAQVADPTKRDHGGLGLGLPLAKALLDAMQGSIDYQRSAEGGSIFRCALPLPAQVQEQRRGQRNLFETSPSPRLQSLYDSDTGLWKVVPEGIEPRLPTVGVTMDQVVYENESRQLARPGQIDGGVSM